MAFKCTRIFLAHVSSKMPKTPPKKDSPKNPLHALGELDSPKAFPPIYDYWHKRLFTQSTVKHKPVFVTVASVSDKSYRTLDEELQKQRSLVKGFGGDIALPPLSYDWVVGLCNKIKLKAVSPVAIRVFMRFADARLEGHAPLTVRSVFVQEFKTIEDLRQLVLFLLLGCSLRETNHAIERIWPGKSVRQILEINQLIEFALYMVKPLLVSEIARLDAGARAAFLCQVDQYCANVLDYMMQSPIKRYRNAYLVMDNFRYANRAATSMLKNECVASGLGSANIVDVETFQAQKQNGSAEDEGLSDGNSAVASDSEEVTLVNPATASGGIQATSLKGPKHLSKTLKLVYNSYFPGRDCNDASSPKICEILPAYQSLGRLGSISYYTTELVHDVRRITQESGSAPQSHRLLDLIKLIVTLEPVHPFVPAYALLKLHEYKETCHFVPLLAKELRMREFAATVNKYAFQKANLLSGPPPRHLRQAMRQINTDQQVQPYTISADTKVVFVNSAELMNEFGRALADARVVGVDAEWPSLNLELQLLRPEMAVSVIQFGMKLGGGSKAVYLLDMVTILEDSALLSTLCDILQGFYVRDNVVTVGFSIRNDLEVLHQLFLSLPKAPKVVVDLQSPKNRDLLKDFVGWVPPSSGPKEAKKLFGQGGLAKLVEHTLNLRMDKSYQVSNWHQRPLKDEQLEYAALDVLSLIDIYTFKDNRLDWKTNDLS